MAASPLGGRSLPFKIPAGIDALKARDARFWTAHAAWVEAEADFEAWPGFPDECGRAQILFDRASRLREAMLSIGTRTGAALSMKIEAIREAGWQTLADTLPCQLTVGEVIEADAARIAKFEIWGADAFQDMSEG